MFSTIIAYIPSVIGLLVIGLVTFLKNTRNRLNILFFVYAFIIALWLLFLFAGDLTLSTSVSLWALRGAAFIGTPIIALTLYLSIVFPVVVHKSHWYFHFLTLFPAVVFMVLALTPYMIPSVELQAASAQPTGLGLIYTLQTAYVFVGFVAALIILFYKRRFVDARQRAQIGLFMFGLFVVLAANLMTGYVLAVLNLGNNYSNAIGGLSFVALIAVVSYAIIKHRLFDIRLGIARTLGFL